MSIDSASLLSYYNSRIGLSSAGGLNSDTPSLTGPNRTTSPTGQSKAPTSPWSFRSPMANESQLVKDVLAGRKFISSSNVELDLSGADQDYNKLFTLYQGMSALQGLSTKALDKTTSEIDLTKIRKRFEVGMAEVRGHLAGTKYDHLNLIQGNLSETTKTTVGVARSNPVYRADSIHQGTASGAVKAFEGDIKFSITVNRLGTSSASQINIDLSEMGSETRSMSNVVSHINTKLEAAGLNTRFSVFRKPAVAETIMVGGKPITVSKGLDSFSLELKGVTYETVKFDAPTKADSLMVFQATGVEPTDKKKIVEGAPPAIQRGLVKVQSNQPNGSDPLPTTLSKVGDTYFTDGISQQSKLDPVIQKVRQSLAGADGSVYVLADINASLAGQDIKGDTDVALVKYDSASNVVYTRTLGATENATGFAMSLSQDGKVAIAGSVRGRLSANTDTLVNGVGTIEQTTGLNSQLSDSFVTLFDGEGAELWTKRRGSSAEDEALAVTFGADGSVMVGGRTKGVQPNTNASIQGGYDNYLTRYSSAGVHQSTIMSGGSGNDQISAMTVDGTNLYVVSVESGEAKLSVYDTTSTTPVLSQTRNLGGLGGGQITDFQVYDNKVYIGGSTASGSLLAGGTITRAYGGTHDAFALVVNKDLGQNNNDKIAFYGGAGSEAGAQVRFTDGKAWMAGSTDGEIAGTTKIGKNDAFIARLDVDTGVVEQSLRLTGKDATVRPESIAISKNGASTLDRLGLPQGTLDFKDDTKIVSATSARPGDQFYVLDRSNGSKKTVTIEAADTLESLAKKIASASGYKIKADVTKITAKPLDQLTLKPVGATTKVEFLAGSLGRDALESLGLAEGLISKEASTIIDPKSSGYQKVRKPIGVGLDVGSNLNTEIAAKEAQANLKTALRNLQKAYTWLTTGDPQPVKSNRNGNTSGQAPAYLTNQIANYQAALDRLTGGG